MENKDNETISIKEILTFCLQNQTVGNLLLNSSNIFEFYNNILEFVTNRRLLNGLDIDPIVFKYFWILNTHIDLLYKEPYFIKPAHIKPITLSTLTIKKIPLKIEHGINFDKSTIILQQSQWNYSNDINISDLTVFSINHLLIASAKIKLLL